MKNINSNSKRVMITLFVLLLSVVGMKNTFAQGQVAILQHNDTLSAFYGPNALSLAHTAASDGDTITLSSGNFEGCTLSKAVTIHGAGCVEDTASHRPPTRFVSTLTISKSDGTMPLTMEGIWFGTIYQYTSNNVRFNKCNIDWFNNTYSGYNANGFYFDNCIIKNLEVCGSGLLIQNSVVWLTYYNQKDQYNMNFIFNSVVCFNNNVTMNNTRGFNSILATADGNTASNSTFYNCIDIQTGNSNLFEGQLNQTNMQVSGYEDVFETFAGTVDYNEEYQLKSEIATSFLGNDGTEVGIHGGMNPYNSRPPYMIIRNTEVAGRTTDDDKLNVQIHLISNGN
jgi:hypothetical protein